MCGDFYRHLPFGGHQRCGESVPSEKDAELVLSDPKTPLAERGNTLYRGAYITSGYGKLLVAQVGGDTEFGTIARELGDAKKPVRRFRRSWPAWGRPSPSWG